MKSELNSNFKKISNNMEGARKNLEANKDIP